MTGGPEAISQTTRLGSEIRVTCERLVHRGLGLAHLEGQVVFLFGALPGEEVTATVTETHRRHLFATVTEVAKPSPDRVTPRCPYFGECGGCQLQHASYPLQLRSKWEILIDALSRRGIPWSGPPDILESRDQWHYRWRGEFHFARDEPGLGFTRRGAYSVLGIASCPIHHPAINSVLAPLGAALRGGPGQAKTVHLTVGQGGEEVLVQSRPDRAPGHRLVEAHRGPLPPRLTDESTALEYRDRGFRVFPDSFIQVNQGSVDLLYETVVDWLAGDLTGARLVDAYGGSGWLSLRLAEAGARVTVIEESPMSARLSQLHSEMHMPGALEVLCGAVEKLLPTVPTPDIVVVDPPRSGLAPQVSGWLAMAGPKLLVYLSCEVSALARDLEALCRIGPYHLERIRIVDMFPQTYHFETVSLLFRE